jgi:excisionase family DNA binding protein
MSSNASDENLFDGHYASASVRPLAVDLAVASRISTLSRRTLENYIRAKRLRARKVGRRTLILMRDLEAFLRSDQPSPKLGKRDA